MSIEINGADDLYRLRQELKKAGATGLWKETLKQFRVLGKVPIAKAKSNARTRLPQAGGLAADVAKSRFTTKTRTGVRTAGVRIEAKNARYNARTVNWGRVRHPLFGNRNHWYDQAIPRDWFYDAMMDSRPVFRAGVQRVLKQVAQDLDRNPFG